MNDTPTTPAEGQSSLEDLSFQQAVDRLEETLRRMEEEAVDIDDLARELRSATELLELCRAKLRRAELEVEQVMADGFEGDDRSGAPTSSD